MAGRLSFKQYFGLELQRKVRHNNAQLHPLRTLFWECTLRCNMHCRHCGSDCKQDSLKPDMPAADFLKAVDDIMPHVDPHHTFIIFTGGEALMRPDIEEVGLELYRREFPWGMVTNGYLLTPQRLESLLAAGMHSITVSLDGFEAEHNWIRQHDHSFERAEAAVKLLVKDKDLLWDIVTCVNPRSYPHLDEFKEYLISLGVPRWRVFTIFPMGRAANDPELQLCDEAFRGTLDFIERTRNEGCIAVNYACEGFLGPYEQRVRNQFFTCRAGVDVASVLVDGSISAQAFGPISRRATSTTIACGRYGKTASRNIATAVGRRKGSATAAPCGAIARAPACTSTTRTKTFSSAITDGWGSSSSESGMQ